MPIFPELGFSTDWGQDAPMDDPEYDGAAAGPSSNDNLTPAATPSSRRRRSARRTYGPQGGRRKGTACVRCRIQKTRCDDEEPSCANCLKAGQACLRARGNPELDSYVQELEGKVRQLERQLHEAQRQQAKGTTTGATPTAIRGDHAAQHMTSISSTPTTATEINSGEPLAHNVGLLSLANSREPKYLGPSSGVVFGRLVFAAIPATQGLPTSLADQSRKTRHISRPPHLRDDAEPPTNADLLYFVDAYFEVYQPLYPFLDQTVILEALDRIAPDLDLVMDASSERNRSVVTIEHIQALLVSALGARALEHRLRTNYGADYLYAGAIQRLEKVPILETVRGVQVLLLLTLASFSFQDGYNAWYLTSTIIASCLDLGLQRRAPEAGQGRNETNDAGLAQASRGTNHTSGSSTSLRSGIFWSAYSIDRTLCVVLGRPLTLRDEALDADFPDGRRSHNDDGDLPTAPHNTSTSSISPQISGQSSSVRPTPGNQEAAYNVACFSFRFDQITSEIKLMLHRVSQSPRRFPWPTDIPQWQVEVQKACEDLLEQIHSASRRETAHSHNRRGRASVHERTLQVLELKYHGCIMLLHRPSPAVPRPTNESMSRCFDSARSTIAIYIAMHRFGNLPHTWLASHAVFVSGITLLYCLWTTQALRTGTEMDAVKRDCDGCVKLLKVLGETWSVAEDAMLKFERLVELTEKSWHTPRPSNTTTSTAMPPNEPAIRHDWVAPDTTEPTLPRLISPNGLGLDNAGMASTDLFLGELGDMSTWFDLSWLNDTEVFPVMPYT